MISIHVSFFRGQNFKSYSFINRIVSAEKNQEIYTRKQITTRSRQGTRMSEWPCQ